ncbi:sulfurtransferase [Arcobacter sp. CECT 8983]|uniref:rhodanese-like domain-containing protein n=1 Tax=Arcobacter sp. CECT 8983 TaxID=2044508 RepID=UPI00100A2B7D|nr:rhodanese-like domain-containing protein [Arcobacter sp. CECT 8983]RXJ89430.1 sulfurtransferase [Arcobacter sp. CECT 8983]
MSEIIDLPVDEVEKLINEDVIMIDIRREDEFKHTGIIKNSHKMTFFDMFGNCDVPTWLSQFEKLVKSKDQLVVLICAHANRTRVVGDFLIQNHGYTNIAHLEGGMANWLDHNKQTVFN